MNVNVGALLTVLQLSDSGLPTGAFAHSLGMETAIHEGRIRTEADYAAWIVHVLHHQLAPTEGYAVRAIVRDGEDPAHLARLLDAQALPAQVRDAATAVGGRTLQIATTSAPSPGLAAYAAAVADGTPAHPAVVVALTGADAGLSWEEVCAAHLFSLTTSLTQNAVRGVPLGQNAGQRVLTTLRREVATAVEAVALMTAEEFGATSPGIEIDQMRHAFQRARMFMS